VAEIQAEKHICGARGKRGRLGRARSETRIKCHRERRNQKLERRPGGGSRSGRSLQQVAKERERREKRGSNASLSNNGGRRIRSKARTAALLKAERERDRNHRMDQPSQKKKVPLFRGLECRLGFQASGGKSALRRARGGRGEKRPPKFCRLTSPQQSPVYSAKEDRS